MKTINQFIYANVYGKMPIKPKVAKQLLEVKAVEKLKK